MLKASQNKNVLSWRLKAPKVYIEDRNCMINTLVF